MTFSFTNYAAIKPQRSPFRDIVSDILGGYSGAVNAKYLPREKEADIFHKQISPLAMLASSPYFSSLHPAQQQQMAQYISQMLSRQGIGEGGQQGSGMGSGMMSGGGGQQGASPGMSGGMGGQSMGGQGQSAPQGDMDENGDPLIPGNPGEHFTSKFGESSYTPGTAHRGKGGEAIYTPKGSNVQKGLDVLRETKGFTNLFNEYRSAASEVAKAGPLKQDLSVVAGNLEKVGNPVTSKISEFLGGGKVADAYAKMKSTGAKMAPALKSIGFHDAEINDMFTIHPGESGKNFEDRMDKTLPVILRKIKEHQRSLNQGVNVSKNSEGTTQPEMLLIGPDGSQGFVSADKAMELIRSGQFKEAGQ